MYRNRQLWLVFLLGAVCIGILGIWTQSPASAAYPTSARSTLPTQDPYHHLSGVVAVPPSLMMSGLHNGGTESAGAQQQWAGPLTPPVFGPNVDATLNNSADQNETTVSINPDNDQIIIGAANDYRANLKPEVYRTTDGGTTWVNYQVPGAGSLFYGDPAVTSDHSNYSYFSYLGYTAICAAQGGMYVSNSTDAGATMSTPVQLAANSVGGSTAIFNDKEYVTVDANPTSPNSGNVYVAWTRFIFTIGGDCGSTTSQVGAPIVVSRSTDHGVTWTSPITASQVFSNNNSFVSPVIGRHGEVYLYYLGGATQQQTNYDSILFSRSTDGGQTFPFFTHISSLTDLPSPLPHTSFRDNAGGSLAADQQLDGYLYAVWSDYATGDADILLSRSTDNGDTWGTPIRLNDDPVANGKDQFFPWIASSPDGYVHVGWFDRREDANDQNYKEYYTYSSDHGATWAPNVAVSTAPSVPGGSSFIGDYSGIAASTGVVMPMWTDIRAGSNQNAYVARGVYTTGTPSTGTPTPSNTPMPTQTSTSTPTPTLTPAATATGTVTIAATVTPSATPTCIPNWTVVSSPNPGTQANGLEAVAAISSNDVWAVGLYDSDTGDQTLVEHWNGTSWSVVTSPNMGTGGSVLAGVAAVSASDVWAVGDYYNGTVDQTLVEHWDGTSWAIVTSANVGTSLNDFFGVAAVSTSDVWAVGDYYNGSWPQTLVEHWNGTSWAVVTSPNVGAFDNILRGVAAVSSNDVWAVGFYSTVDQTLVEHWNGSAWTVVTSPNAGPDDNLLYGVAAVSSSDVWAVGQYFVGGSGYQTLVEHWNGSEWSVIPSPNVGMSDNYLNGVAAVSSSDVWAVGYYQGSVYLALVEHWNGSEWSVVPSPNVGTGYNYLNGIAAVSSSDVWAVGYYQGSVNQTLVERYNSCAGSPTTTPSPTSTATPTATNANTSTPVLSTPSPTSTACSLQFTDVPPGSTFYSFIHCLACLGIINGYPDGTFKPGNNVTRGQLSKIVSNSAGFNDNQTTQMFQDVPVGSTFFQYIGRLASRSFISGYPCGGPGEPCGPGNLPYFRPNANSTRGQISKIVSNAKGFNETPIGQQFQDVPSSNAFYAFIYRLVLHSVMSGYPCGTPPAGACEPGNLPYFLPNNNATRGQTSKIVANTFFPNCEIPLSR